MPDSQNRSIYIKGPTILTPDVSIEGGSVLVSNGIIHSIGVVDEVSQPDDSQVIEANGYRLVPGFIDLQVNGGFGKDFTPEPESIWEVAAELPRYGVTAFLPTVITSPKETFERAKDVFAIGAPAGFSGAVPLGLHLEGPFLNVAKKGAHNPVYLQPANLEFVANWSPEKGVRLVTLAPELPGALEVTQSLVERGVRVSAGHSMADYEQAKRGFEAGICYGTHLFNAMPPLQHREPGLIGALFENERLTVGLIADGIHVHPTMVKLAWQILGSNRLTLVSDAMTALGMPPGTYSVGDFDVTVDQKTARLADGTLAGSILSLDQALRNLIQFAGCSLTEALLTITATPADLLGISGQRGRIAPGQLADLVLLTPDLEVELTIVEGQILYSKGNLS